MSNRCISSAIALFIVVVVYIAVLISVATTDALPSVPKDQGELNLERAYADLHHIAARPHQYNSHANDVVHGYILQRLRDIAVGHDHIQVINDDTSKIYVTSSLVPVPQYFEGNNLLVKIEGTDPAYRNKGGVLFSAHFDSVSTAPGPTDDGMGTTTLIQLVELLAHNRPKRTAVFNINNGEELGLLGASAFMQHPWSNITDTFLNLEGGAAGGKPVILQASSAAMLNAFLNKDVPHQHANAIAADTFTSGLIGSGTDFAVYNAGGMEGIDLSFYRGRTRYHTRLDAIGYTEGQEASLWSMMEAARGVSLALLNNDETHSEKRDSKGDAPVYFDLLTTALVVFPLSGLFAFNIVLLVIGPIALFFIIVFVSPSIHDLEPIDGGAEYNTLLNKTREWFTERDWRLEIWKFGRFWLAILVTIGLQALLVLAFVKINPLVISGYPYLVLFSSFALAFTTTLLILSFPIGKSLATPRQERSDVLVQSYILTWILVLVSTILIGTTGIRSLYFITTWHGLVFVACLIGLVEDMFLSRHGDIMLEDEIRDTRSTENTPLIGRRGLSRIVFGDFWWLVQLLLVLPLPVIMVLEMTLVFFGMMAQTLSDGANAAIIYVGTAILGVLLVLPASPFVVAVERKFGYIFALIFIISAISALSAFPFTPSNPLKVNFQQRILLGDVITPSGLAPSESLQVLNASIVHSGTRVETVLGGVPGYAKLLTPKLPSSLGKEVVCKPSSTRKGIEECTWESSDRMPSPGGNLQNWNARLAGDTQLGRWIRTKVERTGTSSARFTVKGRNSRSCHLYFDNHPVTKYIVKGAEKSVKSRIFQSFREVKLWSRTWDREFVVDVEWSQELGNGSAEGLKGRIACGWVEYESGMVDNGSLTGEERPKIPAFEEFLSFLPEWVSVTKATDALVEVSSEFVV